MTEFTERWKHFASERGFSTLAFLYDEIVGEWDDGGEGRRAIDAQFYERSRLLGLDTSQVCPHCRQRVDQVETINYQCFVCDAKEEGMRLDSALALHDAERALVDGPSDEGRRLRAETMMFLNGVMRRDVQ